MLIKTIHCALLKLNSFLQIFFIKLKILIPYNVGLPMCLLILILKFINYYAVRTACFIIYIAHTDLLNDFVTFYACLDEL